MTTIHPIAFSQNVSEGDITSQICHVNRNIDRLMTQLISVRTGADSNDNKQEQQKIESQIRQLQTQKMQLEHRKADVETQQKQHESHEVSELDNKRVEASGRKTGVYV